jgi:OOP family OmpA-OmpF porin
MKKITLIALLTSSSSLLLAQNQVEGFYAGLNLGLATSSNYLQDNGSTGSQTNLSPSISFGYQFNQYLATEIDYLYVSDYTISKTNSIGNETLKQNQQFLTANIKGILPLDEKFSLFGKFGIGYNFANAEASGVVNQSVNSNNFVPVIGIGASYNLTEKVQLSVVDDYYIVSAPTISSSSANDSNFGYGNTNFLSLGINYKF